MSYKQKYEAIVQRCKELHSSGNALTKLQMEIICPELIEDRDEKIRRYLIQYVSLLSSLIFNDAGFSKEDVLNWLEKQKSNKENNEM